MKVFEGIGELAAAAGTDLGTSNLVVVDQERIEAFTDATGDHQWIHADVDRANDGPFGGTIAHGFLALPRLPAIWHELYDVRGVRMSVNYGLGKDRFINPVPAGAKIRGSAAITEATRLGGDVQATVIATIQIDGGDQPVAVVESIVRNVG